MQLYGFVRIYDAKVGSTSPVTAYWDWLVCLFGFVTAQMFCPARMSKLLGHWYSLGGPLIPPSAVHACRWIFRTITAAVLIGFAVNYILQLYRGVKPNPIKLLLLTSGIGTWWFSVAYVENVILGAALFDICHDVQYLAIVWLYNCGRVRSNPRIGRFMSYLFRRGMVLMYLGLIAAYGAFGLIPSFVQDGTVSTILTGILGTSTILHYYYDGFIWKVREKSTQVSLGLNQGGSSMGIRKMAVGGGMHLLKWSVLIVAVGWLFTTELLVPSMAQTRKDELDKRYVQTLTRDAVLPASEEEINWLFAQFERVQNTAASVPGDQNAQLRAAIMLANFGRNDDAVDSLEKLLKLHPAFSTGYMTLGEINLYRGNLDKASDCFQAGLSHATSELERSTGNLKLGEVYLNQKQFELAKVKFQEALKHNPELESSVDALRKMN